MTKTNPSMYQIAFRKAINKGPRVLNINGEDKAAYYLSREELKKIFGQEGFKTDGITWLKFICDWKDLWDEVAPSKQRIQDPDEDWNIIFVHLNVPQLSELRKFGETYGVRIVAVDA